MKPGGLSGDEQPSSRPIKPGLTASGSCTTRSLPTTRVNPVELVDELVQAYEASLRLQNVLRPLIPRMTWYQAADVVWQHETDWPIEELDATIMFTDIAGFSALMDTHSIKVVLGSLNDYFALLGRIVQQRRGDVHKFLGDGLMALFICPTDAVEAGCAVQQAVAELNAQRAAQGLWRFETRLAIDTGEVVVVSLGSSARRDRTVLGRPVNVAKRLQEQATPGRVWLSQATYGRLSDQSDCRCLGPVKVKGPRRPVVVYEKH